ncbi:MAG TPA: hypothetical protein VGD98_25500 [Ktedonobacteraceae bacterium]
MSKQSKQQEMLHHLRSLEARPDEQVCYALEILERERGEQVVAQALAVLTSIPTVQARPSLLRLYAYYHEAGVKRDAGGGLRMALLAALLSIADARDQALAERAIFTYEFLPPTREECAGGLRAAGLILLHNLDPLLASYHGTRLLVDQYNTSRMSGEPAVSAARLLAEQGQLLPLYSYLFSGGHAEVEAACLRNLSRAPAAIIETLLSFYTSLTSTGTGVPIPRHESKEDVVLLGLFDLLLAFPANQACLSFLETFLRETTRAEVYHSVLTTIIATHASQPWKIVQQVARTERRLEKIGYLLSTCALAQPEPATQQIIENLQQRKTQAGKPGSMLS